MGKTRGDVPIAGLGLLAYKSASEAFPLSRVEEPLLLVGASADRRVLYTSSQAMKRPANDSYGVHGKRSQAIPVEAIAGYVPLTSISR